MIGEAAQIKEHLRVDGAMPLVRGLPDRDGERLLRLLVLAQGLAQQFTASIVPKYI